MTQPQIRVMPSGVEPRGTAPLPIGSSAGHAVQFYDNDNYLAATVADFLAEGLAAGQPAIVIATQIHRDAFVVRLKVKGLDVDEAIRSGNLVLLDARETLASFMVGDRPDPAKFKAVVGGAIDEVLRRATHPTARAYGEMVDILWRDGNTTAAIQLEELWNDLAAAHSFALLCAYAMGNFYSEAHSKAFHDVCRAHSRVIPTESYTQASEEERAIEISLLQQRARALATEVEHRKDLEARLRAALIEAESASRAKTDFLAVMSHELRTPLNAIGGHVQLLQMGVHGNMNDDQRTSLMRVAQNQRRLLAMINDLLNLARVESGRVKYAEDDIDVAWLLDEVTATIEPLFAGAGLECSIRTPADTRLKICGDQDKVQQILTNLLTNAIKYTPAGGSVTIEALPHPSGERKVCIRVTDTGPGIPAAKLETIFDPFVQLGTHRSAHDGLGLGLAISRDLARGMGGDVVAESVPGNGATFVLTLPRV